MQPMQPMQPQAPAAPAVPKPPANLTMGSVDTATVAQEHRPIVASLQTLFGACEAAAGAHPARTDRRTTVRRRLQSARSRTSINTKLVHALY